MNRVAESVSISLRRARPGAGRALAFAGLLVLTLGLAACGGGSGGGASGGTGSGGTGSGGPGSGHDGGTGGSNGGGGSGGGGGTGGAGGSTGSSTVSPVVYVADQEVFEKYELFVSDPSTQAPPVRLNGPLSADSDVWDYKFLPSANTVVYTADQDITYRTELYLVNLNSPGASVRLNTALTPNRDVIDFAVSADGSKVIYRADQDADDIYELYLVNVASPGVSVKVSGNLVYGGWVRSDFNFSPDGTKVLYRADEDTYDRVELYMVDLASPGTSHKMNGQLVSGGNVYTSFSFSPDSATVGYVADQETDDKLELYSVAVATPGTTHKLNGAIIPEGDVCRFEWSPDSKRVAYCADQETDEVLELYTVPLDSPGQSVKVNPPLVAGGEVSTGYEFSPDSSFMLYAAYQDSTTRLDLYRVEVALPGVATKVNAPLVESGSVVSFQIKKDGTRVAYVANQENEAVYEVYEADFLTPGVVTKLSAPMADAGAYRVRYEADGQHVVYLADQDSTYSEIYRVDLATPAVSTKLNGTLTAGGEVFDFDLAQ
jgi:Tol biopolymer transport system component